MCAILPFLALLLGMSGDMSRRHSPGFNVVMPFELPCHRVGRDIQYTGTFGRVWVQRGPLLSCSCTVPTAVVWAGCMLARHAVRIHLW